MKTRGGLAIQRAKNALKKVAVLAASIFVLGSACKGKEAKPAPVLVHNPWGVSSPLPPPVVVRNPWFNVSLPKRLPPGVDYMENFGGDIKIYTRHNKVIDSKNKKTPETKPIPVANTSSTGRVEDIEIKVDGIIQSRNGAQQVKEFKSEDTGSILRVKADGIILESDEMPQGIMSTF